MVSVFRLTSFNWFLLLLTRRHNITSNLLFNLHQFKPKVVQFQHTKFIFSLETIASSFAGTDCSLCWVSHGDISPTLLTLTSPLLFGLGCEPIRTSGPAKYACVDCRWAP